MPVDELGDLFGIELEDDDVDSVGGLLTKAVGRLPLAGSRGQISGLILIADRTEGRRKRVSTVLVERDRALIDAQAAFAGDNEESETGISRPIAQDSNNPGAISAGTGPIKTHPIKTQKKQSKK